LNAGLRWEYDGYAYDKNGNHVDFWYNLAAQVPIPPATGTLAGYTEASNYTGDLPAGVVRRSVKDQTANGAPYHDFGPRLGFAWQPFSDTGKFVVRGGAGIYYSQIDINNMATTDSNNPPAYAAEGFSGAANSRATWLQPWTANTTLGFATFTRFPNSTLSSGTVDPNLVVPTVYNMNLNVQYEFLPSWLLQVGYVDTRGVRLWASQPLNIPVVVQPNTAGINNLSTPLPGVNCANITANGGTGCVLTNTPTNANQRVPIVGFTAGGIRESLDNAGDSDFSSLQVTLRKRFSHGLTFQAAYTFSKTITDITGVERGGSVNSNYPLDHEQQRGPADFSRPQRFILNYTYDLPRFHQGQGFAGKTLSGWGAAGVITIQSGLPMTLTDSLGGAIYGGAGVSRAQLCPGFTYNQIVNPGSIQSKLNNYFNLNAFADTAATAGSSTCALPIVGAFASPGTGLPASPGATGFGNTGRGIILGPPQDDWDVSALKKTTVGGLKENATLKFRADFYNAFNHRQFNNPGLAVSRTSTSFGVITSSSVATRIIQFGLRYAF